MVGCHDGWTGSSTGALATFNLRVGTRGVHIERERTNRRFGRPGPVVGINHKSTRHDTLAGPPISPSRRDVR